MLRLEEYEQIRSLLETRRYSLRQVAKMTGFSRGTVTTVANGRKPPQQPQPEEIEYPNGKPGRCDICGRAVQLPCLHCQIEAMPKKAVFMNDENEVDYEVNLTGIHKTRYEKVRKWRESCDNPHFDSFPSNHTLRSQDDVQ